MMELKISDELALKFRDYIKRGLHEYIQLHDKTAMLDDRATLIARVAELEAENKRLQGRLDWRANNDGSTHWGDCWKDHYYCAMDKIARLTAEGDALRNANIFPLYDEEEGRTKQYRVVLVPVDTPAQEGEKNESVG